MSVVAELTQLHKRIDELTTEVSGLKSAIQDNLDDAVLACDYYGITPSKTAIEAFQRLMATPEKGQGT